jgi:hypothetical protein
LSDAVIWRFQNHQSTASAPFAANSVEISMVVERRFLKRAELSTWVYRDGEMGARF